MCIRDSSRDRPDNPQFDMTDGQGEQCGHFHRHRVVVLLSSALLPAHVATNVAQIRQSGAFFQSWPKPCLVTAAGPPTEFAARWCAQREQVLCEPRRDCDSKRVHMPQYTIPLVRPHTLYTSHHKCSTYDTTPRRHCTQSTRPTLLTHTPDSPARRPDPKP